jgi:hypothetical protein
LAGIKEKGATDALGQTFLPNDTDVMEHIASLYSAETAA